MINMSKLGNSTLAILEASRTGWVFCLGDDEDSAWRSVDGFYEGVLGHSPTPHITRSDKVWGRVSPKAPKSRLPREGDGIAFYHSTRAEFPKTDQYRRKPRISLVGVLDEVHLEGRKVTHIEFTFGRDVAKALREHPIVRNEDTREIFERCELKSGFPAAFYFADRQAWGKILELVRQRVSSNPRRRADRGSKDVSTPGPRELLRALESSLAESHTDVDTSEQARDLLARLGQGQFSGTVRANYRSRCCFPKCNVEDSQFLVGSHIARWADVPGLRGNTSNRLCLCLMHDRAFELGLFTITSGYKIHVSKAAPASAWCRKFLAPLEGLEIRPGRGAAFFESASAPLEENWKPSGLSFR